MDLGEEGDILVVDDDRGIRETLGDVLSDEGYAVQLAADGTEALERLRRGAAPQLILLDLAMPGMPGPEFLAAQQRDGRLRQIPVIVLSADERSSIEGIVGWLRKPVDLDELLGAVGRIVQPARTGPARGG